MLTQKFIKNIATIPFPHGLKLINKAAELK